MQRGMAKEPSICVHHHCVINEKCSTCDFVKSNFLNMGFSFPFEESNSYCNILQIYFKAKVPISVLVVVSSNTCIKAEGARGHINDLRKTEWYHVLQH